jgi:putative transcriptional regulator
MDDLAPGSLLISVPMMEDPNFRRSVVLICEHNEKGSFGLTLNRPIDASLADVLDGVYAFDPTLHLGGPVQRDTLHFVHCAGDRIPDGIDLPGGITWGGNFDAVQELAQSGELSNDDIRFFLGYSGWSPGQLENEIGEDAWIVAPSGGRVLFEEAADELWRAVLRRLGGEYALLSTFPDDPRMN